MDSLTLTMLQVRAANALLAVVALSSSSLTPRTVALSSHRRSSVATRITWIPLESRDASACHSFHSSRGRSSLRGAVAPLLSQVTAGVPAPSTAAMKDDSKMRLTSALAFMTGWADVTLMTKYKSFATMMTGNTMWMASAAIDNRFKDMGYYASIIVCYVAGLVVFRRSDLSLKNKSLTYVCAPSVLALFALADYLSCLNPSNRWPSMMMLSLGYGIINSVGTEVAGTLAFVVTGHMTKVTNLVVDRFSRKAGRVRLTKADRTAVKRSTCVIGSFFGGAIWAWGLLQRWPNLLVRGNFTIMGVLYAILFLWQDRETLGGWWLRDDQLMCSIDELETTCE